MQRNTLAALHVVLFNAGLFTLPVQAQDIPLLDEILVTATRIPTSDILATYASEVHTRRMIEQTGSGTLYDYLAQHSSVQILPNYGNKFTPKIDMRGYGIGDGYQNIVITLDGRRLNNTDLGSQLIGAIPLADIERIEITKGSGSVMFGDGATAGSIQIVTRQHEGVSVQASAGNFGSMASTVTAGLKKERLSLSASADYANLDGYSNPDSTGHTDASSNRSWRGGLQLRPVDRVKLNLDLASSRIDTRYIETLTQQEFDVNPAQNGGNTYTHQKLKSDLWRIGAGIELAEGLFLTANHSHEDKQTNWISYNSKSDYEYASDDLALQYQNDNFDIAIGAQRFDGTRISTSNRTSKDNNGWYAQGQYRFGETTVSAGARKENVEYTYNPNSGTNLLAEHDLSAWDVGVNHRLDNRLSLFANYNRAFQAPDIDRFFNFGGTFNNFIDPARSRTFNLGLNHVTPNNRLKATLFRSELLNEIFLDPFSYKNTNIDKSQKYGFELQDTWRVSEPFSVNLNYTLTRAIIDRENEGSGTYDGKDLPGVPKHSVNLSLAYRLSPATSFSLSHAWRSSTFAAEDFSNSFTQKQAAYQATDIAIRYRLKNLEWLASIDNLFEHANGLWIHDDAIYPVNFTRNWRVGMKASF
jgi:iron complex outermembrane receptor protein